MGKKIYFADKVLFNPIVVGPSVIISILIFIFLNSYIDSVLSLLGVFFIFLISPFVFILLIGGIIIFFHGMYKIFEVGAK